MTCQDENEIKGKKSTMNVFFFAIKDTGSLCNYYKEREGAEIKFTIQDFTQFLKYTHNQGRGGGGL